MYKQVYLKLRREKMYEQVYLRVFLDIREKSEGGRKNAPQHVGG